MALLIKIVFFFLDKRTNGPYKHIRIYKGIENDLLALWLNVIVLVLSPYSKLY